MTSSTISQTFKFDFIQDGDDEQAQAAQDRKKEINEPALMEISLTELLDTLPSLISYSPLQILSSGNHPEIFLSRRDLFDARFQLISQTGTEQSDQVEGLEFLDAPSDLLPGVYEGGLKTWESSLDLVQVLSSINFELSGRNILEVGCGTAIPSAYLLRQLFTLDEARNAGETHLYLQDFNRSVLELITLPNILLAWYMSPSSASYRDAFKVGTDVGEDTEHPPLPPSDPVAPGELPINPALVAAFLESLSDKNLHIHFLRGSWSTCSIDPRFDIILTSETMYRSDSIPVLLDVLWKAYANPRSHAIDATLEGAVEERLSLGDPKCYVAGKVLYFGAGGGLPDFISELEDPRGTKCSRRNGKWEVLKEHSQGVVRKVLQVSWD
ncbi:hypothetical protein BDM02DRAFT_3266297 [Thelephora ganbajun]|uniref:Uncharacterized protein n=1 Tax=Thelephora ganbajun TaxID=370292 RepID=A0ACB6ZSH9_THEGA|nr:hypothetical protein BDM02DRAFT_3266297 [Thelephora ganbajun]